MMTNNTIYENDINNILAGELDLTLLKKEKF